METPTQMIERWAKEDREYLASLERKKWYGRVIMGLLFVLIIVMVGVGNAPHTAVEVPVVDSAIVQQWQEEREGYQRKIAELTAASNARAVKIKSLLYVINQYEQQLKALAVSVPPQPVILQAVQREAATPEGFKRVVARSFPGVKVRVE